MNPTLIFHASFVDRHKISTIQHIQEFPHKKSFLMCLFFTLAHKLVLDNGKENYLFPDYAKRLKYDNTNKIDSETSNIFSDNCQNLVSLSKKYDHQIDFFEEIDSGCKFQKSYFIILQYLINNLLYVVISNISVTYISKSHNFD